MNSVTTSMTEQTPETAYAETEQKAAMLPSVFDYADYREYLREYYSFRKQSGNYSFAMFSKKAGLTSPNYLKLVMDGERNLTDKNIRLFIKALNLGSAEAKYFENLVRYCQATAPDIKTHYFEALSELTRRRRLNVFEIQREHYEMLSKWYVLPLVELVRCHDFKEDGVWVSRRFGRTITPKEAQEGLRLLEKHGMLRRREDGKLEPGSAVIKCESTVTNLALRQFHKAMLGRVTEAIDSEPVERRNLRSLTLAVSAENFPAIVNEIRDFVSELNAKYSQKATSDDKLDSVCQITMQSFLLSKRF